MSNGDQTVSEVGGSRVTSIVGHNWHEGQLKLKVLWDAEEHTWESFLEMKVDHPRLTATYLLENNVTRSKRSDRNLQWAKKTLRDIDRAVRRIARIYDFYLDEKDEVFAVRRTMNRKKKKFSMKPVYQYGIRVPRTVQEAVQLDKENGNTAWEEAIKKEISALVELECFDFKKAGFNPGPNYQYAPLRMIFAVKQDLRRKARLVIGGHLVDVLDNNLYSSTVKGISVKILHVIAHQQQLKLLCGDVGNAFVNAHTNELVFTKAGPEFGDKEGMVLIIRKALYGLKSSAECWHSHFADSLRGLRFMPTRCDPDVWISYQ